MLLFFFFSFLIIKGSFATDHQLYSPTASSSHHVLLDCWNERYSLLISWCPEAQLTLFLLVKLLLWPSGCFSHPSLFTLCYSSSLSHSLHPSIHLNQLWADSGSFCACDKCPFMALHFEKLKLYLYSSNKKCEYSYCTKGDLLCFFLMFSHMMLQQLWFHANSFSF